MSSCLTESWVPCLMLCFDCNGKSTAAIGCALQKVVLVKFRAGILYMPHYCTHQDREKRMYNKMWQHTYLSHMGNDVYTLVRKYCSWAQSGCRVEHEWKRQPFLVAGLLEFVYIHISRLLLWTTTRNGRVKISTDGFSKLTPVITSREIQVTQKRQYSSAVWSCPMRYDHTYSLAMGPNLLADSLSPSATFAV